MAFSYLKEVFRITHSPYADTTAPDPDTAPLIRYGHNEHAVLLALANRANEKTGVCWPGYASLCRGMQMSRSAVVRAITNLKKIGFVSVKPPTSMRKSNTYRIDITKLKQAGDWCEEQANALPEEDAVDADSTDPDTSL